MRVKVTIKVSVTIKASWCFARVWQLCSSSHASDSCTVAHNVHVTLCLMAMAKLLDTINTVLYMIILVWDLFSNTKHKYVPEAGLLGTMQLNQTVSLAVRNSTSCTCDDCHT